MYNGIINQYKQYLNIEDESKIVTLNEGRTLFHRLRNLLKALGLTNADIYIKKYFLSI